MLAICWKRVDHTKLEWIQSSLVFVLIQKLITVRNGKQLLRTLTTRNEWRWFEHHGHRIITVTYCLCLSFYISSQFCRVYSGRGCSWLSANPSPSIDENTRQNPTNVKLLFTQFYSIISTISCVALWSWSIVVYQKFVISRSQCCIAFLV